MREYNDSDNPHTCEEQPEIDRQEFVVYGKPPGMAHKLIAPPGRWRQLTRKYPFEGDIIWDTKTASWRDFEPDDSIIPAYAYLCVLRHVNEELMMDKSKALDLQVQVIGKDGEFTIRDYLIELLATLWNQGEGFSAKRPLGNSDWCWPVYQTLVEHGYIEGKVDARDGSVVDVDIKTADKFITELIVEYLPGGRRHE